jgi:methylated-DNA-[protein]-cysteine S-methyltransferase
VLSAAVEQLTAYFAGTRAGFDLPLAPAGTPFQQQVWDALLAIPYGATASYGEIAAAVGRPPGRGSPAGRAAPRPRSGPWAWRTGATRSP